MFLNKKLISHIFWIIIASAVGTGVGYLIINGGPLAYGAVYGKTPNLSLKNESSAAEIIPGPSPKINSVPAIVEKPADIPDKENAISIGFVGDIVPEINTSGNIFTDIIPYTEKTDIMVGNLEGVATSNIYNKCGTDSPNCFSFNGDNKFLKLLSDASFDVLNIANNHFNDYGEIGKEVTIDEIGNAGMVPSGVKNEITFVTRNDFRVGFVGFSTYPWTTNMNDEKNLRKLIAAAAQSADVVVVIFHGGSEGAKYAHTPNETEWYLGENRGNLRSFTHSAIDAGADIVLGSGPHVLRGIEWYKNKLIAYSLGNFASVSSLSTSGSLKISAMIETAFRKDGSTVSAKISPFIIDVYGIPHPDPSNAAISAINELSKEDFGEHGAILGTDGEIVR